MLKPAHKSARTPVSITAGQDNPGTNPNENFTGSAPKRSDMPNAEREETIHGIRPE